MLLGVPLIPYLIMISCSIVSGLSGFTTASHSQSSQWQGSASVLWTWPHRQRQSMDLDDGIGVSCV
jgi:hypothetical protein